MSETTGTGPADAKGATAPTNATGGADATGPVDATGPTDPEAHGGPGMSALADDAHGSRPEGMASTSDADRTQTGSATTGGPASGNGATAEAVDDMRSTANEAIDQISAQAKDALSNAKEAADGGVAYVRAKYRENPVLVIAVGAAALIGIATVLKAIFRR